MNSIRVNARSNKVLMLFVAFIALIASVVAVPGAAWADQGAGGVDPSTQQAQNQLQSSVKTAVAGNIYQLEGGGTTTGNDLLVLNNATHQYSIDGVKYSQLTSDSQKQFVGDLKGAADYAASPKNPQKSPLVTGQTVTDWFQSLKGTPGVGSKLLEDSLGEFAPDFATGQQIVHPVMKPANVIAAILVIFVMIGAILSVLLDVLYITIPFVRSALGGNEDSGSDKKGFVKKVMSVSTDARNAMKKADQEDGSTASALLDYLKKRIFAFIVLGILLVLFAAGKIGAIIGFFMDLV